MDSSLLPFFKPKGVVVVGASASVEKLGYGVARNLMQSGYPGAIHFVSQKPGQLFGKSLYTNLNQVPEPVDLAIVIVPPIVTARTIEECGKRGIKAAIIISSGFREVGPEGAALEGQCLEMAREHHVRLLGPNCIGLIDTHFPLDTSFLQPPMPVPGQIGLISHSGAFCAAIIDWSRREGFGFSQIVSLGNQVDVNETDLLAAMAEDESTQVVALYMESVSDGRRFVEVAREVTRRRPVVALKAGRFESGQRAAASHTGALAASDKAFDAAFDKAGILRAASVEQMFDWARVLDSYPNGFGADPAVTPGEATGRSHRIAILTDAGGPGVIAADSLEQNGLQLAPLSRVTLEALAAQLPPAASIHNPVDMLASASPDTYASCLRILLEDENVDGVLVILPPPPMFKAKDVAETILEVIAGQRVLGRVKPVVVALLGSALLEEAQFTFRQANIPTYPFPERAASALGALCMRSNSLKARIGMYKDPGDSHLFRGPITSSSPEELLKAYGIETAAVRLATSVEEARSLADELGYPVVMKIASPDILHKSDVGGVILNLEDSYSLSRAFMRIMEDVREKIPSARINGVHIQRQIATGQEVIVGAVRDPQFGPLMMFGSGGVEVEGLKDVAFALAPLTQTEAWKVVRSTWAGRKLKGFRNLPPADDESLIDVLINLSHLILEQESITEIEINPLRVLEKGTIAVDVRVK